MTPIYTSSPIEAHIIAVFMKAQYAIASFFHGTPVFRGLLFGALTWAILHQFLRIATHRHQAGHAMLMIAYRVGMVFLAIGLLSWGADGITFSSATMPWNDYPGVRNDPRYSDTLDGQTTSLWAYTLIYRALDSVAQTSAAVVGQAFSDDTLANDPTFLTEQLRRMDTFALSPQTMEYWNGLGECLKKDSPTTSEVPSSSDASAQMLLDVGSTASQDCQDRWAAFQSAATADGQALIAQYPDYVRNHLLQVLSQKVPGIGEEQLQRIAVSWAFQNSVKDLDVVAKDSAATPDSPSTSTTASAENLSTQPERTQLNSTVKQLMDVNQNEASLGFTKLQAEMSMAAPMIPAARGYVEGILAVLFVIAAYSVGFGTWKYLLMWCMAQASVCFYRPVALLGYKVAEYFLLENTMAQNLAATSNDPLVFGGARVLREQLVNIQSVYVAFEFGAFMVFCVGAVPIFRQLSSMMLMPRHEDAGVGAPTPSNQPGTTVNDLGGRRAGMEAGLTAGQAVATARLVAGAHQSPSLTHDGLAPPAGPIDAGNDVQPPPSSNWT